MRKISIHSKEIAYDYVKDVFKGLDHEELWILFVNCRNIPISFENSARINLGVRMDVI